MTPEEQRDQDFILPTKWLRRTTYVAFVWGLALGTFESLTDKSGNVLIFSGGLILLGMGLRVAVGRAADRIFGK